MKRNMPVLFFFALFLVTALLSAPAWANPGSERGMAISATDLPEDLQAYDVKDYFLPAQDEQVGYIQTLMGTVVVVREKMQQAYFATKGDAIFQADTFVTLETSRCRIKFTTQDVVTMGANTRIRVDALVDDRKARQKKSLLSMLRGKAMFYVVRLFKYKRTQASVKTPTAVCGVRGTQFGIEIQGKASRRAQAVPIYLADAAGSTGLLLSQAAGGDQTIVYFYDGQGELCNADGSNCFPVQKGESGLVDPEGNVYVSVADPDKAAQFRRDTDIGPGAGEEDYSDKTNEKPPWRGTFPDKVEPETLGEHTKDAKDESIDQGTGVERLPHQGPVGGPNDDG
jgi:hypothetical protein